MIKRIANLSMLLAFALGLGFVESLIPFTFGLPGVKLGLPNLAIVLVLYLYGAREALMVNLARVLLSGFLFGNFAAILYSLAGAMGSLAAMALLKRGRLFSVTGISIAGGTVHNISQLLVAVWVVKTWQVVYYLPFLLAAGCMTGLCLGVCAVQVLKRLPAGIGET